MLRILLLFSISCALVAGQSFTGTWVSPPGSCVSGDKCCCPTSPVVVTQTSAFEVSVSGSADGGSGCFGQTALSGTFNIQNATAASYSQTVGQNTVSLMLALKDPNQLVLTSSLGLCPVLLIRSGAPVTSPSNTNANTPTQPIQQPVQTTKPSQQPSQTQTQQQQQLPTQTIYTSPTSGGTQMYSQPSFAMPFGQASVQQLFAQPFGQPQAQAQAQVQPQQTAQAQAQTQAQPQAGGLFAGPRAQGQQQGQAGAGGREGPLPHPGPRGGAGAAGQGQGPMHGPGAGGPGPHAAGAGMNAMAANPYLAQLAVAQLNGQQPTAQQLLTLQQLQQMQQAQLAGQLGVGGNPYLQQQVAANPNLQQQQQMYYVPMTNAYGLQQMAPAAAAGYNALNYGAQTGVGMNMGQMPAAAAMH